MALNSPRRPGALAAQPTPRGQLLVLRPAPTTTTAAGLDEASEHVALWSALREGRPEAPRLVWTRFAPLVKRLLLRTLGPSVDLEDVLQDVFICLFRKVGELRDPAAFRPFVVSITMLTAKARLRRRWREKRLFFLWSHEDELPSHGLPVLPDPEGRQAVQHFYRLLDRLGPTDRAIFVLRFVEEMEMSEVADALGISLSTAKRKARRLWTRMRAAVVRDPALAPFLGEEGP